jgi:hypothetical protein
MAAQVGLLAVSVLALCTTLPVSCLLQEPTPPTGLPGPGCVQGNAWQQLWAAAAPVPAARQRPLFDPQLEGERALHFLETLPPPALFSELLAVGFSAAVQLLQAAGQAAELPAVRCQLDCLVAAAGPELQQGVAAAGAEGSGDVAGSTLAAAAAAAEQQWQDGEPSNGHARGSNSGSTGPPQRLASWVHSIFSSGLGRGSFRRLLLLLGCTEQAVVAAHSLLLRLQSERGQAQGADGRGGEGEHAAAAADGLIAAALGDQQKQQEEHEPAGAWAQHVAAVESSVDLAAAHWPAVQALVTAQQQTWQEEENASNASSSDSMGINESWPEPFQRDWVLEVRHGSGSQPAGPPGDAAAGVAATQPAGSGKVLQRMYVKALPFEVRIATAVSCETCLSL